MPKSSIIYDNGLAYVARNRAGYLNKILVKVVKDNENYCIIDQYNTNELESLNYSLDEIKAMYKINEYDEILVNPSTKQILQ